MRISDWSSDVCSSDLDATACRGVRVRSVPAARPWGPAPPHIFTQLQPGNKLSGVRTALSARGEEALRPHKSALSARTMTDAPDYRDTVRSEEQTSELQSLMRISYAVFCLKKKKVTHVTHAI